MADKEEARWRVTPSNARDITKLTKELIRLESVVVAQTNQIGSFWDFCNRMKKHLNLSDPRGAEAVRHFMQHSNLFLKQRVVGSELE
tara:strand:- start:268 stop:528 length:261 start_codon:yes stop_codon:yes gene_type:complete